jgi:hypothetical protein
VISENLDAVFDQVADLNSVQPSEQETVSVKEIEPEEIKKEDPLVIYRIIRPAEEPKPEPVTPVTKYVVR